MMTVPPGPPSLANNGSSTRPYLVRALHDWCTDNGFTPYIAVQVDASVQVPHEHVKNNEIVLNIGFEATSSLKLGNDFIEFSARFGGTSRQIVVPIDHVIAIYARENGQGMAFPAPSTAPSATVSETPAPPTERPGAGLRLAGADKAAPTGTPRTVTARKPKLTEVTPEPPETTPPSGRPSLKRIK